MLGLDEYDLDLKEFRKRCAKGLLPREILFCFDAYAPIAKRDEDYDWLRIVRDGHRFIDSREGLKNKLDRKNLDQYLRKLVKLQVLSKVNGRYKIGPGAFTQPFKFNNIKDRISKAVPENTWTGHGITLVGLTEGPAKKLGKRIIYPETLAFKKTNQELIDFVVKQFEKPTVEVWRNFLYYPDYEWQRDRDGNILPDTEREVTQRKPGQYDRLPLIVIDPNSFLKVLPGFKEAVLEARKRQENMEQN
ncbi:hypothetical protein [Methanomassiliicoccus luminyensis]|uniref:hypothetical protein n=1 Tax=Methanomassiliicoccus luminyensis TaxID=1080712 RepID=UPI0011CCBA3C|nr:hypothetical protein [Methanomassiliicoccus luminyensis]